MMPLDEETERLMRQSGGDIDAAVFEQPMELPEMDLTEKPPAVALLERVKGGDVDRESFDRAFPPMPEAGPSAPPMSEARGGSQPDWKGMSERLKMARTKQHGAKFADDMYTGTLGVLNPHYRSNSAATADSDVAAAGDELTLAKARHGMELADSAEADRKAKISRRVKGDEWREMAERMRMVDKAQRPTKAERPPSLPPMVDAEMAQLKADAAKLKQEKTRAEIEKLKRQPKAKVDPTEKEGRKLATKDAEGMPYGYHLRPGAHPSIVQKQAAGDIIEQHSSLMPLVADVRTLVAQPNAIANPKTRKLIAQRVQQIGTKIRAMENLGVPSGKDMEIQEAIIGNPNSPVNAVLDATTGLLAGLESYSAGNVKARLERMGIRADNEEVPKAADHGKVKRETKSFREYEDGYIEEK